MNHIERNAIVLVIVLFGCTSNSVRNEKDKSSLLPSNSPELFLPTLINSTWNVRDITITSDNTEIFYTIVAPKNKFSVIMTTKEQNHKWSTPEIASFSGQYSDLEPALSPDGNKLFFASNRPDSIGGNPKDYDIWMVERKNDGWSEPINLGDSINTEGNEFFPSVALSGNLYYTANYEDSKGREDIYMSEYKNEKYGKPQSLSDAVNTSLYEFNAFVSADESTLVFTSYGRKDDAGGGDLYISKKNNGNWSEAINLGNKINSAYLDYSPFLSEDGKILYFTSERTEIESSYINRLSTNQLNDLMNSPLNGKGNIYWVKLN